MAGGISRRQFGVAAGGALAGGVAACGTRDTKPATPTSAPASAPPLGYTVNVNDPDGGPGYVFFVSGTTAANPAAGSRAAILVIADKSGRVVWQRELPAGQTAGNLRVQNYQGKPVLTWWQGLKQGGHGLGLSYIADEHYNVIDTVTPGGELSSDIHEFRLTPDGRALITSYQEVVTDLSAVGGPKNGRIYNCIASVVDIERHQTMFQWDALTHVPVSDSPAKYRAGQVLDPYHMNSIALDPAGNLVISMRALSTVFNVDPRTGAINWRLGGKQSTFALADRVEFAYQHDVEMPDANTITLFDNHFEGNAGQTSGGSVPSSLKWIQAGPRRAHDRSPARAAPPGQTQQRRHGQPATPTRRQYLLRLGNGRTHRRVRGRRQDALRRRPGRRHLPRLPQCVDRRPRRTTEDGLRRRHRARRLERSHRSTPLAPDARPAKHRDDDAGHRRLGRIRHPDAAAGQHRRVLPIAGTGRRRDRHRSDSATAARRLDPDARILLPMAGSPAYGDPVQGTPFGRYRLQDVMGQGGMGEVWRAYDTATNRTVAIKLLPPQLATDQTFVERFRREAEAAAQLNNPHIIPIHNYGEIDGRLYVDMRLVEGRDLEQILLNGPLPPPRAVHIVEQVARALRAAHQVGLVHRDVKPSNILLDQDDFAYLIDFGIARGADDPGLTGPGAMIGSWQYMAPERLMAQDADARADIYALTCVLYECLTGNRPFPGDSLESQVAAHLGAPPPRPSVTRPDVPVEFDAVIAKGMAKEPDDRYQTVTELAAAVQEAPVDPESAASSAATLEAPAQETRAARAPLFARMSRRARIAAGVSVLAVVAAVIATTTVRVHSASLRPPPSAARPSAPSSPAPTEVVLPLAGLSGPLGLAADGAGNVYVADNGNNRVVRLEAGTMDQSVLPFSGLRYAVGVAVDGSGTVYVTDSYNERVVKVAAGAAAQSVVMLDRNGPHGVALDGAGNLFLVDWLKDRVLKLAAGTGAQTVLPITGIEDPEGVAVDGAGNVYVADFGNGRVVKLAAATGAQTTMPFFGLVNPWGVTVDGPGNVYVTDSGTGRVVRLAAATGTQTVLPFPALNDPHGVAVDGAGNLYVADSGRNRVLKLPKA